MLLIYLRNDVRDEVTRLISRSKETRMNFIKAEIIDRKIENAYGGSGEEKKEENTQAATHDFNVDREGQISTTQPAIIDPEFPMEMSHISGRFNLENFDIILSPKGKYDKYNEVPSNDVLEMALSEDQFLNTADHIRLQNKVAEFAMIVLSNKSARAKNTPIFSSQKTGKKSRRHVRTTKEPHNREDTSSEVSGSATGESGNSSNAYIEDSSTAFTKGPGRNAPSFSPTGFMSQPRTAPSVPVQNQDRSKPAEAFINVPPQQVLPDGYSYTPPGFGPYNKRSGNFDPSFNSNPNPYNYPIGQSFNSFEPRTSTWPYFQDGLPPASLSPLPMDPEKEAMKRQLAEIKSAQDAQEAEMKRRQLEKRIKEEAEAEFHQKMEQMQREDELLAEERARSLEQAKKEIEEAKRETARVTREAIETERRAAAERKKADQDAIARVEESARLKLEAEIRQKVEAETAAKFKDSKSEGKVKKILGNLFS